MRSETGDGQGKRNTPIGKRQRNATSSLAPHRAARLQEKGQQIDEAFNEQINHCSQSCDELIEHAKNITSLEDMSACIEMTSSLNHSIGRAHENVLALQALQSELLQQTKEAITSQTTVKGIIRDELKGFDKEQAIQIEHFFSNPGFSHSPADHHVTPFQLAVLFKMSEGRKISDAVFQTLGFIRQHEARQYQYTEHETETMRNNIKQMAQAAYQEVKDLEKYIRFEQGFIKRLKGIELDCLEKGKPIYSSYEDRCALLISEEPVNACRTDNTLALPEVPVELEQPLEGDTHAVDFSCYAETEESGGLYVQTKNDKDQIEEKRFIPFSHDVVELMLRVNNYRSKSFRIPFEEFVRASLEEKREVCSSWMDEAHRRYVSKMSYEGAEAQGRMQEVLRQHFSVGLASIANQLKSSAYRARREHEEESIQISRPMEKGEALYIRYFAELKEVTMSQIEKLKKQKKECLKSKNRTKRETISRTIDELNSTIDKLNSTKVNIERVEESVKEVKLDKSDIQFYGFKEAKKLQVQQHLQQLAANLETTRLAISSTTHFFPIQDNVQQEEKKMALCQKN